MDVSLEGRQILVVFDNSDSQPQRIAVEAAIRTLYVREGSITEEMPDGFAVEIGLPFCLASTRDCLYRIRNKH